LCHQKAALRSNLEFLPYWNCPRGALLGDGISTSAGGEVDGGAEKGELGEFGFDSFFVECGKAGSLLFL
jgi:hypothetical protein